MRMARRHSTSHRSSTRLDRAFISLVACTSVLCVAAAVAPQVAGASTRGSGAVDVLYAGSFEDLMQQVVGPAFAAGDQLQRERILGWIGCASPGDPRQDRGG